MSQNNLPYRLSEIESNQGIRFSHSGASPGHHCPMHTALAVIRNIQGVSSLVVGMPECTFYSRYVMEDSVGPHGELHYTYVLDSNEVVFGCREGLVKALEEMENDGAKSIVVVMTCIPALIGEDIEEVTETFSEEHGAKAVCIDMAHFKRNGYEAGYYEGYAALEGFCNEKQGEINQVSILGPIKGEEGASVKQWILQHNYEILEINSSFLLEEFVRVNQSCFNIVTHIHFLPLAKKLEMKYQIPYVFLGGVYSVEEISECYHKIKKQLNFSDMPKFMEEVLGRKLEDTIQKHFKNSRFFITAVIEDVLPLAAYLSSLSMKPYFLHLEEYQPWMKEWKDQILSHGNDPFISYLVQNEMKTEILEQTDFWKEEGFCFAIGDVLYKDVISLKVGRAPLYGLLGYERTLTLLSLLRESLEKEGDHATI